MSGPSAENIRSPVPDTAARGRMLAFTGGGAWARLLLPAAGGVILDLWSKAYAFPNAVVPDSPFNGRHPGAPEPLIPHVLGFQTTVNHGAVFGLGQGYGWLFVIFSFVALAAILYVFASSRRNQWVLHIALGLITAGAMGNLYDRVVFGCVRDFLKFYVDWYPYVFNVADVLLCIGVPLLMLCWLSRDLPAEAKPATGK